ncbi:MAG: EamA family transporter [Dermatophilaceae bacterium]|nr:DMT family transporter [Intrasporangiaceae bacterium]
MTPTQRVGGGAAVAALGAAALWGTTGTAQALGPMESDPTSVGALRIAVGSLALLALALPMMRRGSLRRAGHPGRAFAWTQHAVAGGGRGAGLALLLFGGLAVAAYQVCFFLGVARAGVAVGTVVALGIAPLATGLLGLLLGERPTARWMAATAGAVAGVVLLVVGSGAKSAAGIDLVGVAAAAGAGVSYAAYTIAARALLLSAMRGVPVMAAFFSIGALVLLPFLVTADLGWVATPRGLAMVLWLGFVATGLSYVLFQRGIARLPAGTVATMSLAEPVTATILGVLVLGERLSRLSALGIVVVVLGLLLVTVGPRRPASLSPA